MERINRHDMILAIRMDGMPLAMGGFGPAMLVWPRGTDPSLADMNDDDWSWGVIAIEVFSEEVEDGDGTDEVD